MTLNRRVCNPKTRGNNLLKNILISLSMRFNRQKNKRSILQPKRSIGIWEIPMKLYMLIWILWGVLRNTTLMKLGWIIQIESFFLLNTIRGITRAMTDLENTSAQTSDTKTQHKTIPNKNRSHQCPRNYQWRKKRREISDLLIW